MRRRPYWGYYPRRKTPAGKSTRKNYGNTWWGKEWLNAFNNIDYSNRLPRGRTYANKGLAKDILIKGNYISAKVQGTRPSPYEVAFVIPKFSKREKKKLIKLILDNPLHLSRLLNRVLPPELKTLCDKQGLKLFPSSWSDLDGYCSCPDWAVPCKHMAAVLYLIANEIDKNPFIVFQLHNFDLFDELRKLGYAEEGQEEIKIHSTHEWQQNFKGSISSGKWDEEVYRALDFSRIPELKEDLLTILSDKPVFYPLGDFHDILKRAYTAVAKKVKKNRKDTQTDHEPTDIKVDAVEHIELLLDEQRDFVFVTLRDNTGEILHTFEEENVFIEWLQNIPRGEITKYAEVVRTMSLVYDFAEQLCVRAAYIPQLLEVGQTQHYIIRWLPALLNPTISSIFSGLQSILSEDILFYKNGEDVDEPVDADKATALTSFFLQYLVKTHHDLTHQFKEHEVGHLFFNGAALLFNDFETKDYPAAIQLWLNKLYLTKKDFVPVIQVDAQGDGFELNLAIEEAKNKKTDTPIPLSKILSFKKYQKIRMDVLRDVAMLADYFPQISELVASEGKEPLYFDANTFVNVLFKILPTIRLFGIKVLLPKALRKLVRPQLSMKINAEKGVVATASMLNLKELLSFQWQVAMGDEHLSVRHFMKMVKDYSGIVKLNDQYVFFDKEEIQKLIEKLEAPPTLDSKELLQAALSEDYQGAKVMLDAKVKKLMDKLLHGKDAKVPKGLKATLRPYQLDGYRWLYKNTRIGFGSLIADDMGLGKTLQVITTLLKLKEDKALGKEKALIVVPTTLLTNWQNEIQRFAPKLSSHIYHGAGRTLKPIKDADILLTTYGVARNETAALKKHNWLVLVIDEAQNIKNPSTAQTKAIKRINAKIKIAMSGTPVENRLSEYWSIFDFTNKGYLDSLPKFKRAFAKPIEIERDQMKLERFRKITAPFILRRLKSDKSIIKDLPEKIEKDQYCQLTPDQAALYQNVVNQTMDSISESEGIERKGNILKLITALKQVCNHPQHFLKKKNPLPEDSGKTQMLFTLMNSILQNDEKTLIFTQYQEMGQHLVNMIQDEFGLSVPFLHGGISRKGRDHMVNTFQNDRATRILILSLKAGGTGLNLTAANNVIHYDLWWNPAVEAQATDRAYRIGQRKNVLVHRFITKGTFEEKINELLKSKKELADLTVATGEKWIGDYSNEELKDLVTLEEKK